MIRAADLYGRKIQMKRISALFLALCLILGSSIALASDYPFKEGVNYYKTYRDNAAMPSMLNFGWASLVPGEDLYKAPKTTIRKESTEKIEALLDQGKMFYNYAKWRFLERFDSHTIDAMLVMTDPNGKYFATYGEWEMGPSKEKSVYSWFFDVTDCLNRCREENEGKLPKGDYVFSMFFNDQNFRTNRV